MFPGRLNPKQMQKMMKRMGIQTSDIEASSVVIHATDKDIVIENPQVLKTKVGGEEMFQISGKIVEQEAEVEVSIEPEDIAMVAEQANVGEDKAREALEKFNGDIAEAIISLKK